MDQLRVPPARDRPTPPLDSGFAGVTRGDAGATTLRQAQGERNQATGSLRHAQGERPSTECLRVAKGLRMRRWARYKEGGRTSNEGETA